MTTGGVPISDARSEHDLWFAQGFCHAQDRLWQLERTRRFARGTLSEILSESLIPVDKYYRRLGIRRVAERDWPLLNQEAQAILQAFSQGVNAAVASMHELPPEFKVLDLGPGTRNLDTHRQHCAMEGYFPHPVGRLQQQGSSGISYWFTNIGIFIIAQNAIIGERLSGTATWILSAPISRSAFILSKLIPIALGSLITMVIVPGVIAYYEFSLIPADGTSLAFMPLLAGQNVMALQLMFYLCLTFLTGALLPMQILPSWFVNLTSWSLTAAAMALARGETPDSLIPLVSTVVWIVVFLAVAIKRFQPST